MLLWDFSGAANYSHVVYGFGGHDQPGKVISILCRPDPCGLPKGINGEEGKIEMATKTVLVDDMDGGDADLTIAFTINGEGYTMDLSQKNADAFYAAIDPWLSISTRSRSAREATVKSYLVGVEQRAAIREWATKAGMEISPRGRIPQEITEEYNKTHRGSVK